jgi:hypothetical protein
VLTERIVEIVRASTLALLLVCAARSGLARPISAFIWQQQQQQQVQINVSSCKQQQQQQVQVQQ